MIYKFLAFVIILSAIVAGCLIFFRVNQVLVEGESKYTESQIISAAGVEEGDNLLLLPKTEIGLSLIKKLPYLDEVNLMRSLPDTLTITVVDAVPLALVKGETSHWIINQKGKLLEQVTSTVGYEDLIQVEGLTPLSPEAGSTMALGVEAQVKMDSLLDLFSNLTDAGIIQQVTELDYSGSTTVSFLLNEKIWVVLPYLEKDYAAKLDGIILSMEWIQSNESGTLDLTGDVGERWFFIPN